MTKNLVQNNKLYLHPPQTKLPQHLHGQYSYLTPVCKHSPNNPKKEQLCPKVMQQ